jgi:hypothetical protein
VASSRFENYHDQILRADVALVTLRTTVLFLLPNLSSSFAPCSSPSIKLVKERRLTRLALSFLAQRTRKRPYDLVEWPCYRLCVARTLLRRTDSEMSVGLR